MKIFKNKITENKVNESKINENRTNENNVNESKINKNRINNIKQKLQKINIAKTEFLKMELKILKRETNGQGAAEYILLFGGVIVIAIAALMIYKSYFSNAQTNLNASNDFEDLRNAMNAT